ncbi:hypothetical protein Bca52824_094587 [Brassica carinata]|uniref:Uncharacterized protein n=1 Tax=Brassica carinata TaxID=52824 RepID=A0A8X7P1U5_BRACI|nr:hypothetical protein Bca52824_094587 [Brassica carinata]
MGGFAFTWQDISTAHGKGKACEHIDDIPMEIVELMAKNQYERCLPAREEDKQPPQATTSVSKNALLIDLNETYDNSMDNNTTRSGFCVRVTPAKAFSSRVERLLLVLFGCLPHQFL